MKRLIILCFAIAVIFLFLFAEEGDFLKVDASIIPTRLSRGQEGKVVLKLKLASGVTISAQPAFIIECGPSEELIFPKNFFAASDLEIEIKEEDGKEFLMLENPIEIPFAVSINAERGNHIFEGKIKYFACSKEEEWCLKSSAKFSASFYTRSTAVKR